MGSAVGIFRTVSLCLVACLLAACPKDAPQEPTEPRLALSGEGVSSAGEAGAYRLDFGSVDVGASATAELIVANTGGGELTVQLERNPSPPFYGGSLPLTLGAGHRKTIELSFLPMEFGPHERRLSLRTNGADGGRTALLLTGEGQDPYPLVVEGIGPDGCVTFPPTPVGQTRTASVSFSNPTSTTFEISSAVIGAYHGFSVAPNVFELAPGEEGFIEIEFAPRHVETQNEPFTLAYRVPSENSYFLIESCIQGEGIVPPFDCTKTDMNFEEVDIGTRVADRLTCTNVGEPEDAPTRVIGVFTPAEDFQGRIFERDGTPGPKAEGYLPGESFEVEIAFESLRPAMTIGAYAFIEGERFVLHEIDLSASTKNTPPCSLSISPTHLDFGTMLEDRTLQIFVTNDGEAACGILHSLVQPRFGDGTIFSISGGPHREVLEPGQTVAVDVTAWAVSQGWDQSDLVITPALGVQPTFEASLSARVEPSCVHLGPSLQETDGWGCVGPAASLSISNGCDSEVTIDQISVEDAYAFLTLGRRPSLPVTIAPFESVEVEVGYALPPAATHGHPRFHGGVHVFVSQGGAPTTLVAPVELHGRDPVPQSDLFYPSSAEPALILQFHPADSDGDGDVDEDDLEVKLDGVVVAPSTEDGGEETWRYDAEANAVILSPTLVDSAPPEVLVTYLAGCKWAQ